MRLFSTSLHVMAVVSAIATTAGAAMPAPAQKDYTNETQAQKDARLKWFQEAKFGMFIHWGVYSVPAGVYKNDTGLSEWYFDQSKMPMSEYEKFATEFKPVKFDAKAWVKVAKDAGMKYLVITAKHHDGFCLWHSRLTDWDIGRSPYFDHREPLKELADACRAAGLKFCVYYSIMDWHDARYGERRANNDVAKGPTDMPAYVNYMYGQLKELISQFGPLGLVWFDGGWEKCWTEYPNHGSDLYNYLRNLQPSLIVNDRGGDGDYRTYEQSVSGIASDDPWESCITINDHWCYNQADHQWKSTTELVRDLIDCNSKGGNFLLDVGPTADGVIPQPEVDRLEQMGQWLAVNKDAIYGTTAGPFQNTPWGRCTQKADGPNTILYLHIFDWPADGKLLLPGLQSPIQKAYLLADPKKTPIAATASAHGVILDVPTKGTSDISTTVVAVLKGKPAVANLATEQARDGSFVLKADDVIVHGKDLRVERHDGQFNICYWTDEDQYVEWSIQVHKPGKFAVSVESAAPDDTECEFLIDGQSFPFAVAKTGDYGKFEVHALGDLTIPKAGQFSLLVKPVKGKWQPLNLRAITLKPE
jgi:alpha-L-fucosidase